MCFLRKLTTQAHVRGKGFLKRDGRIEPLIDRLVYGSHAAFSQAPHNAIAALQSCARRQKERATIRFNHQLGGQCDLHLGTRIN